MGDNNGDGAVGIRFLDRDGLGEANASDENGDYCGTDHVGVHFDEALE